MIETQFGTLAEAILTILTPDAAGQPHLATVIEKLHGDSPEKTALQSALDRVCKTFAQTYPDLAAAFFDDRLLREPEISFELAKFLIPNQEPDQTILEQAWAAQFDSERHAGITQAVRFFLAELEKAITAQPQLKPFTAVLSHNEQALLLAFGAFFTPQLTPEMLTRYFNGTPDITDEMVDLTRAQNPDLPPEVTNEELRALIQQSISRNIDSAPIKSILDALGSYGLVQAISATDQAVEHYRLRDLAYIYAVVQAGQIERDRALEACFAYLDRYNQPSLENFAALRPELENLIAASAWAFEQGNWVVAEQFAWNLYAQGSQILDYDGAYTQAVTVLERAIQSARQRGDKHDESVHLGSLGTAYFRLSDYARAIQYYQAALAISREIGDRSIEGSNLGNLGVAYESLGDYARAIEHHQAVLDIIRDIGDKSSEASTLGNLGNACLKLGDYVRAIEYYQAVLAITRDIGDQRAEGMTRANLGSAYLKLEDYAAASEHYRVALDITRAIGDKRGEGIRLGNLGSVCFGQGDYAEAIRHYQAALDISRAVEDKRGEGHDLNNLGLAYANLGDYARAIEHYQKARSVFMAIGQQDRVDWADSQIAQLQTSS